MADETEFSEFARNLSVYFQRDDDSIEFTRQLFAHIYKGSINQTDSFVENAERRTLKGYYYHENDITNIAKHIAGDLDLGNFAEFVRLDSEDSIADLCSTFDSTCPGISECTYNMELAERFQTIIKRAAKGKRKSKKKGLQRLVSKETPLSASPLQGKYGVYLVSEEGSMCPNDGCTHSLFTDVNGHLGLLYDVVTIDPDESEEDPDNLIALCPGCAARYRLGPDPTVIRRMKEIKKQFQEQALDRELLSHQEVQEGVRKVIRKIPQMGPAGPVDLNYDPVVLRKKIEPTNITLYLKTKGYVNYYFNVVHQTMQQMEREGELKFKSFCEQVRVNYLVLKERGADQDRIYRELTDWLQQGTEGY